MADYIAPIQRLIEQFRRLPGVGAKTAARYAFATLNLSEEECCDFADAISGVKRDVHKCPVCHGLSASADGCDICRNSSGSADPGRETVIAPCTGHWSTHVSFHSFPGEL